MVGSLADGARCGGVLVLGLPLRSRESDVLLQRRMGMVAGQQVWAS